MTNPFRAMCAELVRRWDTASCDHDLLDVADAMDRARALLDQPEQEGMADEALASFTAWFCKNYPGPDTIIHKPEWHAPKVFRAAAYAITCYGRPTPQPPADGEVAELVEWLLREADYQEIACKRAPCADRIRRAAELLDQPEPPELTDDDLLEHVRWFADEACMETNSGDIADSCRDLIARWGRPTPPPQPVAVSERLPGAEDCDEQGRCWWFTPVDGNLPPYRCDDWSLHAGWLQKYTHWLPANALPVPAEEEQ